MLMFPHTGRYDRLPAWWRRCWTAVATGILALLVFPFMVLFLFLWSLAEIGQARLARPGR